MNGWMDERNWPRHQCRLPPQRCTFRKSIPPMFGDEGWQLSEGWRPLSLPENKINWTVSIKNKIFSLFSKLTFISLLESLVPYTNRELSSSTPGPIPCNLASWTTYILGFTDSSKMIREFLNCLAVLQLKLKYWFCFCFSSPGRARIWRSLGPDTTWHNAGQCYHKCLS
jgi:hypothetical protein